MANTRSGGAAAAAGASRDGQAPPAAAAARKLPNARETRNIPSAASTQTTTQNLRRSTRETKGKNKSRELPTTPSSHRSAARPTAPTPPSKPKDSTRKSTRVRTTTASPKPNQQDPNATSTSAPMPAKRKLDSDAAHTVSRLSKKQKRLMPTKSYIALFNSPEETAESPESNAQDHVNSEPSDVAASKDSEHHSGDLHEMPKVVFEGEKLKTESHQSGLVSESRMPIEICSLNKESEVISMIETGEQAAADSNQNSLPELQNRPCSIVHHKEASMAIEDRDFVGVQAVCTSRQSVAIQRDESDNSHEICVGCSSKGSSDILRSCDGKGCKRRYHISCIDPPLQPVSLGLWLCIICTKKRLQFGVYSVSEGIESLWDVKEGVGYSKQYFVKYKNLAHVHNRWVSESDIVDSTPQGCDLISKFSKRFLKEKTIKWKQEWAEPHRLLKKRSLMHPKEAEEFFKAQGDKIPYCNVEWLVKWKDLGYEHSTWELETSSFLCTPEAAELKRGYENRLEAARRASDPAKVSKVKGGVFQKLHRLPDGCSSGLGDDHLSSLNQLREFWHDSHGAIFIDDQERVIKTILFVASILADICRPVLIVSTSASLSLWETKFNRLAASINVVVYSGEKNTRNTIQDLEFYDDGSMMLQVLLSHPDAILEDIETMEQINWEAVIVDDFQNSRISKCLEQLKRLSTNFRMVLLSSSLKENIPEYTNLLRFLDPEENGISNVSNGVTCDTAGTDLAVLKGKLESYVAFERKEDSSKLLEFWVPARLSQVQLEMYCYTLLSNSPALRSHSKTDSVGALRNIVVSLRKCCDHPYLVDQTLQNSLTEGHPVTDILDIGVHSCGKLLLLDKMLQKIRNEGLRVLILSQSGGGSANPMGDILDDFVRQRFGYESYERVERGLLMQKKQTAMNMFNDKTKGRFIFLIDSRACGPSIKLSSVDAIIIYGSDWNPVNDLRAIQKIGIESQSEHVPIFRLYSSCTVEEKALILAKHDHVLDSSILNITPSLSHCLLSWGASFLFNRLEESQNPSYSSKGSDGDELYTENLALEFLTKALNRVEVNREMYNAAISRAYLHGSFYSRGIIVEGEKEGISSVDGDLPNFWAYWSTLLHGRSPRWQHISEPAQRSRRKIQNMEEQLKNKEGQLKVPAEESDETRIKRRKIGEIVDSSRKVLPSKSKETIFSENNTPSSSNQISVDDTWEELETNNLHGTQKGLHVQLKPELSKLYKLLELPESVKSLCEEFLEYILKNHQVSQEPKGILHAFNIALCWRAASLLKHKMDRTESLARAVKYLFYECNGELAEYVYDKLKILKKKFARRAGEMCKQSHKASVSNTSTCEQESSAKLRNDRLIRTQITSVDCNFENGSCQEASGELWTEKTISGDKEQLSDPETHEEECLSRDELLTRITDKRVTLVDKVFSLRGKVIQDKHSFAASVLDKHRQKEVAKLRDVCNVVVEHLRRNRRNIAQEDWDVKIKLIIEWFSMFRYAFLEHMRHQRKRLDIQQSAAWIKESQLKEEFLQAAKSGRLDHAFDQHIPLPDSEFTMEEFSHFRVKVGSCHVLAAASSPQSLDDDSVMEITLVRSLSPPEVMDSEEVRNRPAEVLIQEQTSEVGLLVNGLHNISDGMDSQRNACLANQRSSSGSPLADSPVNQEPSGGDHIEHVEGENNVGSTFQGGTSQHLGDAAIDVHSVNSNTAASDSPRLEIQPLPAPSSEAILPVSGEVEIQANLVTLSTQQNVAATQLPQGEPEQAGLSGVASSQPLQTGRQQSIQASDNILERTHSDQSQPSHQIDASPASTLQSAELFPVTSMMFNHPPIDSEPLKNELHRLRLHMDTFHKIHELKKTQLRMECGQEIERIKRKYDLLIEEHESTHVQQKKALNEFYEKVLRNQSLAEDFRAKFISASAAQARAHVPPVGQAPQASQQVPMRHPVMGSSASSVASSLASRPPVPRRRVQAPQVDRPSSSLFQVSHSSSASSQGVQPSPVIPPGNLVRATAAPVGHLPPPRVSSGVQSELAARAPAPHLQFKSPRSHSMPPGNQQQLPGRVEATSSRAQPVLVASSSDPHVVSLASSAMPSVHSVLPATSPISHANHLAQPVPPTPNPALQVPVLSSIPSISAGSQVADSGSGSISLDAWLTASLGLSARAPPTPTNNGERDVVCLSDDE